MSTTNSDLELLRYPIGRFRFPEAVRSEDVVSWIEAIEQMPIELGNAIEDLSDEQLNAPYRPGGWTVRQLVHHLADSHMNSFLRFRLALTENRPEIKTYDENSWAALADSRIAPPELSLRLLGALHARWTLLLRSFSPAEWQRVFRHPQLGEVTLERATALYAWHGRHHVAHINALRQQMEW